MKKAAFRLLFSMISVPYGTGDIAEAMISALQMIYASRMKGTDIISYLRSRYIMRRKPYIISRQRRSNLDLRVAEAERSSA